MNKKKIFEYTKIILCIILIIYCGHYYLQTNGSLVLSSMHSNDFKHIYLGAEILRAGCSPYDSDLLFLAAEAHNVGAINPYVYLPFTGIVMSPLTFLQFDTAAKEWFLLNHIFLWSSILIIFFALRSKISLFKITFFIALTSIYFPFYRTLTAGQLNVFILFLFSLILLAHSYKNSFWTGILIAFTTLFKLTPGILLLFFLLKRQWRVLFWASAGFFIFGIVRILFLKPTWLHLIYMLLLAIYLLPVIITTLTAYIKKSKKIFSIGILSFYLCHIFLFFNLKVIKEIEQYLTSNLATVIITALLYLIFFAIYFILLSYLYPYIKNKLEKYKNITKLVLAILIVNAAIVVLITGGLLLFMMNVPAEFLPMLTTMAAGGSTWANYGMTFNVDPFNQSIGSLIRHLFTENQITTPIKNIDTDYAKSIINIISILLLLFTSYLVIKTDSQSKDQANDIQKTALQYSLFIFLALLIPSILWDHYITLLLIPTAVMLIKISSMRKLYSLKLIFVITLIALAVPFRFQHPAFTHGIGILLMSFKLYFVIILYGINCWLVTKQ